MTMDSLVSLLAQSLNANTFQRLILSQPLQATPGSVQKVTVRPIEISGVATYHWSARIGTQEKHENLTAEQFRLRAKATFGQAFGDAHLFTQEADFSLRKRPRGPLKVKRAPSSLAPQSLAGGRAAIIERNSI